MSSPHPRRWWILGVLCLSLLVVVVDNTVLNVAIPSLIRDLHASNSDIQWILDAYIVVFAGLLLTAGALSDRFGRRRGLIIGLVLFGGASVPAAFADSPGQLIAARALMGVGGAFLMPGTLSILTNVFDEEERKKAIAIWSSVLMLGALGGPVVGGLLLEHFWWGSVFLINIPIAALAVIATVLIIPESRGPAGRPDLVGAVLSTVGMTALVWSVIFIPRDGWSAPQVHIGFAVSVLALVGFALWERRVSEPMLPVKLFRDRNFSGASLSIVLLSFSSGGLMLALTQYLQFVLGYSPMKTGLAFIPLLVAVMAFNGIGVVVDKKLGARVALAAGLVLLAGGFGLLAMMSPGDGYPRLVIALVVMGMGSGTAGPAAYGTLLGALPPERAGVGSAVNDTVQQVGQALSVAILGSVLTAAYTDAMPENVTGPARDSIGNALAIAAARGDVALAGAAKSAFVDAMSFTAIAGVFGGLAAAVLAFVVLRPPSHDAEAALSEAVPDVDNQPTAH
ncbi:MFS transporter [Actinomadura citrea]|jgi:EmrB/QacA subfamily drug resistance transporter|uniref:EmrB/QacA subfamily drug resistance transporter n=1 Tax=Actinomadura citrea TaxID=46158 RepID=A0A7Y9KET2_9ACTN|nr:MFS transporter [Actinomadura citrea]NYE14845.1 EmrB/QacA subfamily drug resistance transporter [Actinomadura citrea]GGT82481.1 MFS transporter [Actinomadura citrea]